MNRLLVLILVVAVVALVISGVVRWLPRSKPLPAIAAGTSIAPPTRKGEDKAMLLAQLRALGALAFSVFMFLILLRPSVALTGTLGLPVALTAGVSISAGLVMFSALPQAKDRASEQARGASTKVRASPTPGGTHPIARRAFLAPLAVTLAFLAFLIAAGLASSADNEGKYRVLRVDSSVASPFPGWYYGVPLLLVVLVFAGSALLALHKISTSRALPDPRMAGLDRRWREISARVVLLLCNGGLLAYFGGTALLAGQAMVKLVLPDSTRPLLALGIGCAVLGAALAVAGVVLLVLAARAALTIRTAARAQDTLQAE